MDVFYVLTNLIPHMFWIDVFDTFTCSASFLLHSCLQPEFSSHTFVISLPVVFRSFLTASVWLSIHISPLSSSALALTAIHAALSAYLCADDNKFLPFSFVHFVVLGGGVSTKDHSARGGLISKVQYIERVHVNHSRLHVYIDRFLFSFEHQRLIYLAGEPRVGNQLFSAQTYEHTCTCMCSSFSEVVDLLPDFRSDV